MKEKWQEVLVPTLTTKYLRSHAKVYEAIDGLVFATERECVNHENSIRSFFAYYSGLLASGLYTREKLACSLQRLMQEESAWEKHKDYKSYRASVYALKQILGIREISKA